MIATAFVALLIAACGQQPQQGAAEKDLVEVTRIWDQARHNAFTGLTRFQGSWYCVFREGEHHASHDGALRVITSSDAEQWFSAALIPPRPGYDLRDPHITVTPDGRLMLLGADWDLRDADRRECQTRVWFSSDGKNWGDGVPVGETNVWLWRVTWYQGTAYGVGYSIVEADRFTRLYKSSDGVRFETLVERLFEPGYATESSIVFDEDGTAYCLLRRGGEEENSAQLGMAGPPYTDWTWKDLGLRLGGPDMILLPDGRFLASGRLYDAEEEIRKGGRRTSLLWLDPDGGTMEEFVPLPSGGDTSYPGLVLHGNLLWVSYYSGHESEMTHDNPGRRGTSIYLAKVRLPGQ